MKTKWMLSALFTTVALVLMIPAEQVEACSPPPDLWIEPPTTSSWPISLALGTEVFHMRVGSYFYDLSPDSVDFELHELRDGQFGDTLPVSFSSHLNASGALDVTVDVIDLPVGHYQLTPMMDIEVLDYYSPAYFEIVAGDFEVVASAPTIDITTYEGGNKYCCQIRDCFGCGGGDECRSCWYDRELTQYLIEIEFETRNGQAETEVYVNDQLVRTLRGIHRHSRAYLPLEPEEAPYCVRLVFLSMNGTELHQTEASCFQASDFPALRPPRPIQGQSQYCEGSPELVEGTPRSSGGCSTTEGSAAPLLFLLLSALLSIRRRRP